MSIHSQMREFKETTHLCFRELKSSWEKNLRSVLLFMCTFSFYLTCLWHSTPACAYRTCENESSVFRCTQTPCSLDRWTVTCTHICCESLEDSCCKILKNQTRILIQNLKKIINARCGRHKNKEYTHGCLFVCARKKKAERAIDYTAV